MSIYRLSYKVKDYTELDFNPYQKYMGVGAKPDYSSGYWVVMQHPVTTEFNESRKNIEETLHAIYDLNQTVFWFWPNIDGGSDGTSNGIRAFREKFDLVNFHFFKNMEPFDFLKLLQNSNGIIGNSSVGIRECSFLGVPCINIGDRQKKRYRAENVIDVNYKQKEIKTAINTLKGSAKPKRSKIYGSGNSGSIIAHKLSQLPLIIEKQIHY